MSETAAAAEQVPGNPFAVLPGYTRSLLKVNLPLRVQLARKQETVQKVVEMGPGTIITFQKRCDDPLELLAGNQSVALGEAVKLGDKFGFRVHKMVLPQEHFYSVHRAKQAAE